MLDFRTLSANYLNTSFSVNKNIFIQALCDFGIIFLVCCVFCLFCNVILYQNFSLSIFLVLLPGIFFGIICSAIFILSIRIMKSETMLFVFSWLVTIVLFQFNVAGIKDIRLTERIMGYSVSMEGDLTAFGYFIKFLDPLGVMAILSTIYWVRHIVICKMKSDQISK